MKSIKCNGFLGTAGQEKSFVEVIQGHNGQTQGQTGVSEEVDGGGKDIRRHRRKRTA